MAAVAAADGGMQTIKLTWEKITLGIDIGPKDNRTKKYILNNINGEALPGEMLAIMGPSGSGKTSLLNALARRNDAFEGSLKMNGLDMMGRGLLFNSRTAYMHQDEKFLAELTCREHLQFQAKLRTSLPASERAVKVNSLLLELGLDKIANSLIGDEHGEAGNHISRNERKRLSFASELLTNPTLLFVDEPTTGLDSFMAESVVKTLQGLATGPRQCTIVATIHQPAAETYRLFDKVCFLVGGQVGYFGTLPGVVDFVNELKYPLPMHCCPADHVLRLFVNPDDPEGSQRRRTEIVQAFAAKNPQGNISAVQDLTEAQAKERAEEMAKADRDAATSRNFLVQVITLCVREAIMRARSVKVFRTRLIQHIVFGVWFGLTYLRVEINQGSITTVTAALFFCMMITLFMGPMGVAQTLPEQLKVYLRETRAGSYMITSMYAAKTLLDIPFEAFFTFIWAAITYFMIGFRGDRVGANFGDEVLDFFPFWGCLFLLSYLAFAFGYFAAFTAPISAPEIGFLLTLFMMIPQMIFGGFFINLDVVPKWLHWIRDIALLRHGFTIMNIIQWDNYGSVPCDGDYCPFGADATGKDIRENYVGTELAFLTAVLYLLSMACASTDT